MGNVHSSPITNKAMLEKDGVFELSLDATQLTAGLLNLDRLPATLTGKDADTLDGYNSTELQVILTVADFQANPATGTADDPQNINNGSVVDSAFFDVEDEYCEIDFGFIALISQYRWMGDEINKYLSDKCKIQHWDGSVWVDNTVDIPVVLNVWTDWTSLTKAVLTSKIRWVISQMSVGPFRIRELEVKG